MLDLDQSDSDAPGRKAAGFGANSRRTRLDRRGPTLLGGPERSRSGVCRSTPRVASRRGLAGGRWLHKPTPPLEPSWARPAALPSWTTCGSTGLRATSSRRPNREAGARTTKRARGSHLAGWPRLPQRQSDCDGGHRRPGRSCESSAPSSERAAAPRRSLIGAWCGSLSSAQSEPGRVSRRLGFAPVSVESGF